MEIIIIEQFLTLQPALQQQYVFGLEPWDWVNTKKIYKGLINHIMILYFNTKYSIMAKHLAVVCKWTFPRKDIVNHNNIFCIAHNKSINNYLWRKNSKVSKLNFVNIKP